MTVRVSRELAKRESPVTYLSPIEEMERWFEDAWTRPFSLLTDARWPMLSRNDFEVTSPSVDIYEEGKELVMKADMPGMKREDLEIGITGNVLTISGERKFETKEEKGDFYRCERTYGTFKRSFELPHDVDTENIRAHLENGVLEIRLSKTSESAEKTKKITVS